MEEDEDGVNEEEEEDAEESDKEESAICVKKIRKNPDVDTSFLPDREREEEENRLREELRQVNTLICLSLGLLPLGLHLTSQSVLPHTLDMPKLL